MPTRPVRRPGLATRALEYLLKSHYLADEFPSVVTTAGFAAFYAANYATLPPAEEGLKRVTMYGTFSAHRTVQTRPRPCASASGQSARSMPDPGRKP
jgi:hypothetical protein